MGGRTWYERRMGKDLEMSGTSIHWFQPHIWAEITRYGLKTKQVPKINEAYWLADDRLYTGTQDEMFKKINQGMEAFLKDTLKYFPRPYEPFHEESIKEIDHLSVVDQLREIKPELHTETYDLLCSYWSAYFCTDDLELPALTQAYRWASLANNNWKMLEDIFELYKFKDGTKSLIDRIFNDSQAELKLSSPVSVIKKTDAY